MAGGIIKEHDTLKICECGSTPVLIWHYIKGVANRINYFVKCYNCLKRTNDRRKISGAIDEWNNTISRRQDISMYCSECNIWTKRYDGNMNCLVCGKIVHTININQDYQPDIDYVGKPYE